MLFTDGVSITGTRKTRDNYLVVDARIARTGIQIYAGSEMGCPQMDAVRVYRPETEVFADRALASFAHRPVTNDHPPHMVTAATWRNDAVGMTSDTITRDGEFVRVPFVLMDADTIAEVADGKRELSAGYTASIDWTPGVAPDGEAYDAVMTNISGNHLAIVARGRAGTSCRIGDAWTTTPQQKEPAMADMNRAVIVDGLTINTNDQGAQAIEKLTRDLATARSTLEAKDGELAGLRTSQSGALQAKDGQIAALENAHRTALEAKDGEIAALNAAQPDARAMDGLIAARAAVIDGAKRILGATFDAAGKTVEDIRRAAVMKRLGDSAREKSDEYVAAAFDTMLADGIGRVDPMREALRDGHRHVPSTNPVVAAHAEYTDRLMGGWNQRKGA